MRSSKKPAGLSYIATLAVGLVIAALWASNAFADCSSDNPADCVYVSVGSSSSISPAFPHPSPACQKVTNASCPAQIMVPDSTQVEWSSFVQNHESCATLSDCDTYSATNVTYGSCSGACGGGSGTQTLTSWTCQQYDATTNTTTNPANTTSACAAVAPASSVSCTNNSACSSSASTGPITFIAANQYKICDVSGGSACLMAPDETTGGKFYTLPGRDGNPYNFTYQSSLTAALACSTYAANNPSNSTYIYAVAAYGDASEGCSSCQYAQYSGGGHWEVHESNDNDGFGAMQVVACAADPSFATPSCAAAQVLAPAFGNEQVSVPAGTGYNSALIKEADAAASMPYGTSTNHTWAFLNNYYTNGNLPTQLVTSAAISALPFATVQTAAVKGNTNIFGEGPPIDDYRPSGANTPEFECTENGWSEIPPTCPAITSACLPTQTCVTVGSGRDAHPKCTTTCDAIPGIPSLPPGYMGDTYGSVNYVCLENGQTYNVPNTSLTYPSYKVTTTGWAFCDLTQVPVPGGKNGATQLGNSCTLIQSN